MDECCKTPATAGYSGQRKDQTTPQLSCELCRERKVKCNKLDPCRNCAASGVVCVPIYRLRLPRGRHAHRSRRTSEPQPPRQPSNRDADDAVAAAAAGRSREQVVEGSETQPITSALANPTTSGPAVFKGTKKQGLTVQRPDHFWADLVEEIHELRGVIDPAPGEGDESNGAQASDPAQADSADGGISALGLFGSSNPPPVPRHFAFSRVALSHNKVAAGQLCQVYLRNVDPIIKILHRPTLSKWMLQGERYLGYPEGHASVEALGSAVCYSAASSMTENQCQAMFYTSKSSIAVDCRRACEVAIERSGILATRDVTVLQAFVLYLVGRRSEDRSRAVWTLVALAVRIAKALGLHLDPEAGQSETFFDQQMRKRLWLTICLMDLQASFAQASEPLVGHGEAGSSLTLVRHVNDSDFDPTTTHPVPDREGLTDTTFALVTYHVQLAGRQLNFASHEEKSDAVGGGGYGSGSSSERTVTSFPSNITSDWEARQQHVRRFEQEALGLLHFCDPESSPSAWFTWHGTQCLVAAVRLAALRPLQRARPGNSPAAAPSRTDGGDTELLRQTLLVLEKAQLMHTDPRGEGFRWYVTVPWLALATAIAECYVCADAALVRRAWPVVEASYQHHEAVITRHSGETLQGPLAKLMRQTREKLAVLLLQHGGTQNFGIAGGGGSAQVLPTPLPTPHIAPSGDNLIDPGWAATISSSTTAAMTFGVAAALLPQQMPSPTPLLIDTQSLLAPAAGLLTADPTPPLPSPDLSDPSWRSWDEIMSSSSFEDFANPGFFFSENILGGY